MNNTNEPLSGGSIALIVISVLLSLLIWISIFIAFQNRRKMAHFAMLGGKVGFKKEMRDNKEFLTEKGFYICTDDKIFQKIGNALKHQAKINGFYLTPKELEKQALDSETNKIKSNSESK